MNTSDNALPATQAHRRLHYGLWFAQVALAVAFAMVGFMKLTISPEALAQAMPGGVVLPLVLIRFIGLAEVAGALGVILPSATRILPVLTPVAAAALALVMVLAGAFHVSRSEIASLPVVLALGALALFVAWGRTTRARIPARV